MCRPRFGGHNRDASGSSSVQASKPPKGIAGFAGLFFAYKTSLKFRKARLQATPKKIS
jgi:hypothetical protein